MTPDPVAPLPSGALAADIDCLHLDRPSPERLRAAGISTIGDLAGSGYMSQKGWNALGRDAGKSASAVLDVLCGFSEGDTVDWPRFWQARGIKVIPADVTAGTQDIATLLAAIPRLVPAVLADTTWKRAKPERDWVVIDGRKGLVSSPKTLDELGSGALGLTRERVRQLEVDSMERLRRAWGERFHGITYRLHPDLDAAVSRLAQAAPVVGAPLVEDDLLATLGLGLRTSDRDARRLAFLLELAGCVRLGADGTRRPVVLVVEDDALAAACVRTADRVGRLLTESHVEPMSETDIVVELNRGRRSHLVTLPGLRAAMPLSRCVEPLDDGRWQGRFEFLIGRGNQAFRLISDAGFPLDLDVVTRTINARISGQLVGVRNLSNQLSADGRFVPIGKSGKWGLKGRDDEDAAPIVEMMVETLTRAGRPLTADAIHAAVEARRPVARQSVPAYLSLRDEFAQLRDGTWVLSGWREYREQWDRRPRRPRARRGMSRGDQIAAVLVPYLASAPGRERDLGEVVDRVVEALRVPRHTVYTYLDGRIPGVKRSDTAGSKLVRLERPPGLAEGLTSADARAVISDGEKPRVQFRPTLRWDLAEGFDNPALSRRCAETIAAFANSEGGTLVIGVQPNGSVIGIEPDCEVIPRKRDTREEAFTKALAWVVAEDLGADALAVMAISFVSIGDRTLCFVRIGRSPKPIHLVNGKALELYVRDGATTRLLPGAEANAYVRSRWS